MERSRLASLLVALAMLLALTGAWFATANPSIGGTSRGDNYSCLAPYDTVLNDADNMPGGDPPPDAADIAARCRAAGEARFDRAVAFALVAFALAVGAGTCLLASRGRRTPDPAPH